MCTDFFLIDTPYHWYFETAREVFMYLKCVGGDPFHPCFAIESVLSYSSPLRKDARIIFGKFNKAPTQQHAQLQYYHRRIRINRAPDVEAYNVSSAILDQAYDRLHRESYKEKPYVNFRQFSIDIQSVMAKNVAACKRPLKGESSVGDVLKNNCTIERFGFFQNIVIYRARSGKDCQLGTSANEAFNSQLKGYNANVYASTRERVELTLELFTVSKFITHLMCRHYLIQLAHLHPTSIYG
jgi:hypothetical protein